MSLVRTTALALCFAAAACRSHPDPGTTDSTGQSGSDAGVGTGAGPADGGPADGGPVDAGPPPPDPHRIGGLGLGPWPAAPMTVYGTAQGLLEAPISASTDEAQHLWETRTITSFVYDHFQHPGELYVGSNHGVTRVQPAKFRVPSTSQERSDPTSVEREYYADHVHPVVCDVGSCTGGSDDHPVFGDFYGLTLADDGRLWMAGLTSAAAIRWTPDLQLWRNSWEPDNPFVPAMPGKGANSVFDAIYINLRAVAVTLDGTVWFASGEVESWRGPTFGLAAWRDETPYQRKFVDPRSIGAAEYNVLEMVAWDDKRVLGFPSTGLLVWKPGEARGKRLG